MLPSAVVSVDFFSEFANFHSWDFFVISRQSLLFVGNHSGRVPCVFCPWKMGQKTLKAPSGHPAGSGSDKCAGLFIPIEERPQLDNSKLLS